MTINSIKDLDKIMQLCKKRGIKSIKIDNLEFTISEDHIPTPKLKQAKHIPSETYTPGGIGPDTKIDMPDELTPEQLLFYSAASTSEQM